MKRKADTHWVSIGGSDAGLGKSVSGLGCARSWMGDDMGCWDVGDAVGAECVRVVLWVW